VSSARKKEKLAHGGGKMSMGGDSGGVTPIRRSTRPTYSTDDEGSSGRRSAPEVPEVRAEPMDEALPTYVGVGGGLSNRRIITKLPQELGGERLKDTKLEQIIKYVISPEISTSDIDKLVVDAVNERIALPDCRLLINHTPGLGRGYNLGKEHIQDSLGTYLVKKNQRTSTGTIDVNFCDIAVVTHDEGGMYKGLEKKLR
jgi:hypothetical protein